MRAGIECVLGMARTGVVGVRRRAFGTRARTAAAALLAAASQGACGTSNATSASTSAQGAATSSGSAASGAKSSSHASSQGTSSGSSSGSGTASSAAGFSTPDGGFGSSGDGGACSASLASRVRITEVDVGTAVSYNEVDTPAHAARHLAAAERRVARRLDGHRRAGAHRDARRERRGRRRLGVRALGLRLPGRLRRRQRRRRPREPAVGRGRDRQLRHAREPLRHASEPGDPLLRHVHGALRRRVGDMGGQADRLRRDAPAVSDERHRPEQHRFHLVVCAQRANRFRRRELRGPTSAPPSASRRAAASTFTRAIA